MNIKAISIFKGIRFLGIISGWLVDEGLTNGITMTTLLFVALLFKQAGETQSFSESFFNSIPVTIFCFIVGNGCTVIGGFVSGCIAKSHRVKNGLALWIFEYIRYSYQWFYPSERSFWFGCLENISGIGAACLGAWIAKLILGPGKTEPKSIPAGSSPNV